MACDQAPTKVPSGAEWSLCHGNGGDRIGCDTPDSNNEIYATIGMETRARYEGYANNNFDASAEDGFLWVRAMPYADLHAGPLRLFVQPIAGYAFGVEPAEGPIDQTGLDLLQAFAELDIKMEGGSTLALQGGRALVALGSERLVGRRYGPNTPQSFDGLEATFTHKGSKLQVLRIRPVQAGLKNFDDHMSRSKKLDAVYITVGNRSANGLDIYWMKYRDKAAVYGGLTGVELRRTYGLRYYGSQGDVEWNWEAMVQNGHFGNQRIRAKSIATETSVNLPRIQYEPRIRLRANIATGDRNPEDQKLGTFNAMFPKGKYFGELSPIGPRNIYNLNPDLTFNLTENLNIALAFGMFWRTSISDGVYDLPGNELRGTRNGGSRFIGNQFEITIEWQAQPTLSFAASFSMFRPGPFLKQAGAEASITMVGLETSYAF